MGKEFINCRYVSLIAATTHFKKRKKKVTFQKSEVFREWWPAREVENESMTPFKKQFAIEENMSNIW